MWASKRLRQIDKRLRISNPRPFQPPTSLMDEDLFLSALAGYFNSLHKAEELILPNVRVDSSDVVVFSDFGGTHKSSRAFTYSFLISQQSMASRTVALNQRIREHYKFPFQSELSCKDRRNFWIRDSWNDWLMSFDMVPGILFTMAIERKLVSKIRSKRWLQTQTAEWREAQGTDIDYSTLERMHVITCILAYLLALLITDDQQVVWWCDEDDITITQSHGNCALAYLQSWTDEFFQNQFTKMLASTAAKTPNMSVCDMLSACDIAAGAVSHFIMQAEDRRSVTDPLMRAAVEWLTRSGPYLRKYCLYMDYDETEGMPMVSHAHFGIRPDYARWERSYRETLGRFVPECYR